MDVNDLAGLLVTTLSPFWLFSTLSSSFSSIQPAFLQLASCNGRDLAIDSMIADDILDVFLFFERRLAIFNVGFWFDH